MRHISTIKDDEILPPGETVITDRCEYRIEQRGKRWSCFIGKYQISDHSNYFAMLEWLRNQTLWTR